VVVVKAPKGDVDLRCGGHAMGAIGTDAAGATLDVNHSAGTQMGKRYADEEIGIELLCTKAGDGSLSIGDQALLLKDAKPLPSSD
jgi:hypothetical protein